MKKMIAACIAALAVSASGETFKTYDDFSIVLPDGWAEIPGTVLQAYAEKVEEVSPDTPRPVYDYGYQIDDGNWLTYPYILVQFRPVGRIPWGELARSQEMNSRIADIGGSGVSAGKSTYDKKNHILWSALTTPAQHGEPAKALVAIKLTEAGYIRLVGCATEDSFNEFEKIFIEAFSSLSIDESIAYKPQFGDAMPVVGGIITGRVLVWCIQAVVIGGGLWLGYILVKRLLIFPYNRFLNPNVPAHDDC
jgi:hypothetical protein